MYGDEDGLMDGLLHCHCEVSWWAPDDEVGHVVVTIC